jgi:L-ascorbate metabolism protein UlaG (beta-lactamase superfamily)
MVESNIKREVVSLQAVGGPTAVIAYAGLRFLTDPTLDEPREYPRPTGATLVKLAGPALRPDDVEPIDAVLLSHDHHEDNLDDGGRAFLSRAGRVLTTREGAERLGGGATGMDPFDRVELERAGGGSVRVTATPAEHGPPEFAAQNGPVIGFYLQAEDWPTVYVSGDNASIRTVAEIARRVPAVDAAVLHAGAARVATKFDGRPLSMDGRRVAAAAAVLGADVVVPAHYDGWTHFSEGRDDLELAFREAGLSALLSAAEHGSWTSLRRG